MYLSPDEYKGDIPQDQLQKRLSDAQMAIDGLTFDRIVHQGFDDLTEFQQCLVKEAVKKQAEFAYDNAELLESPLSSYSVSGVSMSFDPAKIMTVNGIVTTAEIYGILMQTGLCYRGLT